jgi:carbamoyltransferase
MVFLGVILSHNASACLMIDGKVTIVAQEERFTKIKNFLGYPKKSIDYILKFLKKEKLIIDSIAFASEFRSTFGLMVPVNHFFTIQDYKDYYGDKYYGRKLKNLSTDQYIKTLINDKRNNFNLYMDFKKYKNKKDLYNVELFKKDLINFIHSQTKVDKDKIFFINHHTCHAHYAYFASINKFTECAVLTMDSKGDHLNQTVWIAKNDEQVLHKIAESADCDLARIYKLTTLFLSMKPDEHEYKIMGMAPYAKKKYAYEVYENVYKNILKVENCKVLKKNRPDDIYKYLKNKLEPYRFDNIAGGLQIFVEEISKKLFTQVYKRTKVTNFALSGGVSMNVKSNKMISELYFVKKLFCPPSGGDESLSIGACYYLAKLSSKPLKNIYLGYNLSEDLDSTDLSKKFQKNKFKISKKVTPNYIAKLLKNGKIIAVARGREEFGARALGNRSILANPKNLDCVKEINEAIKNRDFWMPFALTILSDKQKKIIFNNKKIGCDYMTIAFDTKKDFVENIKAGTHQYDLTVRPQILKRESNEKYYNLINHFYKITGIPAVLNTSLNLHGNPISSSLKDVIHTFKASGLKYLYLDDQYLIEKK